VVAAGAMQRRYPVRCWRAVVADLPLVGQFGHRKQLILDGPQILVADGVASAYSPCAKSPRTNPAAHGFRILAYAVGGLGYGQHVEDGTPRFGPNAQRTLMPSSARTISPSRVRCAAPLLIRSTATASTLPSAQLISDSSRPSRLTTPRRAPSGEGTWGQVGLTRLNARNLRVADTGGSGELLLCQVALLTQLADLAGYGEVSIEGFPARHRLATFGLDLLFDLAEVVIELGGHHRSLN
jgi:hypothetical protein